MHLLHEEVEKAITFDSIAEAEKIAGQTNLAAPKNWYPVPGFRNGHAAFIAYIFKLVRPNRPSVWYCVDYANSWTIAKIRRICVE